MGGGGPWQIQGTWPRASRGAPPGVLTPPSISNLTGGAVGLPPPRCGSPGDTPENRAGCQPIPPQTLLGGARCPVAPPALCHYVPTAGLAPQTHHTQSWPGTHEASLAVEGISQHLLHPTPHLHVLGGPLSLLHLLHQQSPSFLDRQPKTQGQSARWSLACLPHRGPGLGTHIPR